MISALNKFGLLESVDEDLQVSQDAVTILVELQRELLADEPEPLDPSDDANTPESPTTESAPLENEARVSFFITQAQKVRLREQGYSDEQIAKMKPTEAQSDFGIAMKPCHADALALFLNIGRRMVRREILRPAQLVA